MDKIMITPKLSIAGDEWEPFGGGRNWLFDAQIQMNRRNMRAQLTAELREIAIRKGWDDIGIRRLQV
jgi:hypothetical protein